MTGCKCGCDENAARKGGVEEGSKREDGGKEIGETEGTCWREIRGGELYV